MAKEKGKGEGSVFFRKDRKKWVAQYYDYDPVTQERKHKEKSFATEEKSKGIFTIYNVSKGKSSIY